MFENTINYRSEYILDENGHRQQFKVDRSGNYLLDLLEIRNTIEINRNKVDINGNLVDINGNMVDINDVKEVKFEQGNRLFHVLINNEWFDVAADLQSVSTPFNLFQYISNNINPFLIPDRKGEYFRQWRPQIRKPDDIWNEIVKVTDIPGLTSAPKLQPIETRLVMLVDRNACSDGSESLWS